MVSYNKSLIYWSAQLIGWLFYVALNFLAADQSDRSSGDFQLALLLFFVTSILITHGYRWMIIKLDWFRFAIWKLLPRVLFGSLLVATFFLAVRLGMQVYLFKEPLDWKWNEVIMRLISFSFLAFIWSLLYFTYHFFEKSRQQEIKNLQWQASKNEIELNNLKAQLNPHFMFNSMNSIRALIDENPAEAKNAVTQLSAILRNSLMMGKKREVSIREEMMIVKDYLALEKIRFEERLKVSYDISDKASDCGIPPLMLQTLVENGIKHGISKLPDGGEIAIKIKETANRVLIELKNTGRLEKTSDNGKPGIGLANTRKRLELMYAGDGKIELQQNDSYVITSIEIPKHKAYESNNH